MRPGAGLTLIAIGAILTFAVRVDFTGLNVPAVGVILMLTGLVGMALTFMLRKRRVEAAAEAEDAWDGGAETTFSHANDPSQHGSRDDDGSGY